jgi:methyltransferase (TIGR00027 family)
MQEREPSRTALSVAAHRAAHQVLEEGRIFADPLALAILGAQGERAVGISRDNPSTRGMRLFVAARARVAETFLAAAVETRDVGQLVVLGAGLDTFAYRNPFAGRLRVFEVDHPATQAWKRRRLAETRIPVPGDLAFVAVDFERDRPIERLQAAGFDTARRSSFCWLGVVPYLTTPAIEETLAAIAGLPGGAEVVFDYPDPVETLSPEAQAAHRARAARVAALGEPFLSCFEPSELHGRLRRLGFTAIEDLGPRALARRFQGAGPAARSRRDRGGHVLFAATPLS